KAEIEYILMPELSCQVVIKSEQINSSTCPILAGPVDLVRSSEFVGKTAIEFIAPGEKFALGWGSDEAMRVQRSQTKKQEKDHLTQWKRVITQTQLFLSNIAAEPREITITERVPVSELEQVKVKVLTKKTTNEVQPDNDGFCTWKLTLAPYSQRQVTLVYQVATAPEVKGV
ncbi:MAG: mucoidy inhibitor MuiA family protein, partial [Coleofasciculus sp. C2-GNP5-27]